MSRSHRLTSTLSAVALVATLGVVMGGSTASATTDPTVRPAERAAAQRVTVRTAADPAGDQRRFAGWKRFEGMRPLADLTPSVTFSNDAASRKVFVRFRVAKLGGRSTRYRLDYDAVFRVGRMRYNYIYQADRGPAFDYLYVYRGDDFVGNRCTRAIVTTQQPAERSVVASIPWSCFNGKGRFTATAHAEVGVSATPPNDNYVHAVASDRSSAVTLPIR